jgi:hypothetical protein
VAVVDEHVRVAGPDRELDARRDVGQLEHQIGAQMQAADVEVHASVRADRDRVRGTHKRAPKQEYRDDWNHELPELHCPSNLHREVLWAREVGLGQPNRAAPWTGNRGRN